MRAKLSPLGDAERALLLACSRLRLGADHAAEASALLGRRLDWDQVVFYARLHSVAPLLRAHLKRLDGDGRVPPQAWEGLLRLSHRTAYQNRLYARENAALLESFEAAGIRTLIPKGLSLVERVYGDLGLRPLIDLMFMVPIDQLKDAEAVMEARGYAWKVPRPTQGFFRWSCPFALYRVRGEMHYSVLVLGNLITWPRLHWLDPVGVWRRARPAGVSGRTTLELSPEDLVLYLCVQADNHGFFNRCVPDRVDPVDLLFAEWSNNRLVRFVDLHEAIRHHSSVLDWGTMTTLAKESGLDGAAYASLRLTERLLGTGLDSFALETLKPEGSRHRLRGMVTAALLASSEDSGRATLRGRVGRWWKRRRPRTQLFLGRLLGWIEVSFPGLEAVGREYGMRGHTARLALYLLHAIRSVLRSVRSFASLWILRARRGSEIPLRGPRPRHDVWMSQ